MSFRHSHLSNPVGRALVDGSTLFQERVQKASGVGGISVFLGLDDQISFEEGGQISRFSLQIIGTKEFL